MIITKIGRNLRSLLFAPAVIIPRGRFVGRVRVRDAFDPMAFQFRMGAGFFGEVNRKHPFWIEPGLMDPTNPPTMYGQAVVIDATSKKVRRVIAGDTALINLWGVTVRPFPFQDSGSAGAFGAQTLGSVTLPPTNQPIDVLRSGYIIVPVFGSPGKGDPVYTRIAVTSGLQYQGGFEAVSDPGSNVLITLVNTFNTAFNGPPDASGSGVAGAGGAGELIFNV